MIRPNKKILKKFAEFDAQTQQELLKELSITSEQEISLKGLHKLLRSKQTSIKVRLDACSLIMVNDSKKSTGVLLEAFNDKDEDISHIAMLALSTISSDRALEFMIEVLQSSPNEQKRRKAAYVLQGYFDDERATDALSNALNNKTLSSETRAQAAEGLGTLSATRATKILVDNLYDPSFEIRAECIWALGQVGMDEAIIPELKKFLGDKSKVGMWTVDEEACEAIKIIKSRVLALEKYEGDKSKVDIWDIHEESLAIRENIDCD